MHPVECSTNRPQSIRATVNRLPHSCPLTKKRQNCCIVPCSAVPKENRPIQKQKRIMNSSCAAAAATMMTMTMCWRRNEVNQKEGAYLPLITSTPSNDPNGSKWLQRRNRRKHKALREQPVEFVSQNLCGLPCWGWRQVPCSYFCYREQPAPMHWKRKTSNHSAMIQRAAAVVEGCPETTALRRGL